MTDPAIHAESLTKGHGTQPVPHGRDLAMGRPGRPTTPPRRSPLRFYLLVFALSLPFWLTGVVADRRGYRLPVPMELPVSALMAAVPLTAAVILVRWEEPGGGAGRLLRRVLDPRRIAGRRWYLPILFLNPAILLLSYGAMRLLDRPLPEPRVVLWTAPILFVVFLLPAIGEEGGWMGYAADPLQARLGP